MTNEYTLKEQLDFEFNQIDNLNNICNLIRTLENIYKFNKMHFICDETIDDMLNTMFNIVELLTSKNKLHILANNKNELQSIISKIKKIPPLNSLDFNELCCLIYSIGNIKNFKGYHLRERNIKIKNLKYTDIEKDNIIKLKELANKILRIIYVLITTNRIQSKINLNCYYKNHFLDILKTNHKIQQEKLRKVFVSNLIPFMTIITIIIFFISWHDVNQTLTNLGLSEYINYLDTFSIAISAKMKIIGILVCLTAISGYFGFYTQMLYHDEYLSGRQTVLIFGIISKSIIITVPLILYKILYNTTLIQNSMYLIAIFTMLIIESLIQIKYYRAKFINIILQLLVVIIYLTLTLAISYTIKSNINISELIANELILLIYVIIIVINIKIEPKYRFGFILIAFCLPAIYWYLNYYSQHNVLELTNFATPSNEISLIKVETDNLNLRSELKMNSFVEIQIPTNFESQDIFSGRKMILENIKHKSAFNDTTNLKSIITLCNNKNYRYELQEISLQNEKTVDSFTKESDCVRNIHKLGNLEYLNQQTWAKKIFTIQKINNLYVYWIYGVHVPLFLKNKILIMVGSSYQGKPLYKIKAIKLDSENGLKNFSIIDSFYYEKESDISGHIQDLYDNLYN